MAYHEKRVRAGGEQLVKSQVADIKAWQGCLMPQLSPWLPVCHQQLEITHVGRRAAGKGEDLTNLCLEQARSRRDWLRLAFPVGVIGSPNLKLTTYERDSLSCTTLIGGYSWCAWVRLIEYFLGSSRFKRGKFLG